MSTTSISAVRFFADVWISAIRRQFKRLAPDPTIQSESDQLIEWFGEMNLFLVAATRLRRAAKLGIVAGLPLEPDLAAFDAAAPDVVQMRDLGEHFDDYARGIGRHDDRIRRIRPTATLAAAEALYQAIVAVASK